MPVKRKTIMKRKQSPLTEAESNWLYDQCLDPLGGGMFYFADADVKQAFWTRNRDDVLIWWMENKPCSRPGRWWDFDSPRQIIGDFPPEVWNFPAVRQRLGGIGTPKYEVLNFVPRFISGIPTDWVDEWSADYYNGRSFDIHGKRIGTNYQEGDFAGLAIDPDDPPAYESQAAYLQRHGLLTVAELAHLKRHPALLAPETGVTLKTNCEPGGRG